MNGEDMEPDIEPITPRDSVVRFYRDRHIVGALQHWLVIPFDGPLIVWLVSVVVYVWGLYGLGKSTVEARSRR